MSKLRSLLDRLVPAVDACAVHCGEYYCYTTRTNVGGRTCWVEFCGAACGPMTPGRIFNCL
ncbi:hypothetical protein [Microbispora rosea]|uniref:hypothetical protein n=1 Tax=Microbispora rosea TaxID=58117 RepID=UPI00341D38F0